MHCTHTAHINIVNEYCKQLDTQKLGRNRSVSQKIKNYPLCQVKKKNPTNLNRK